jgi:neutral ceramidase
MSPFAPDVLLTSLPFEPSGLIGRVLSLPRDFTLGVYWIGDLTIGTLPGEFTTMLGRRLAAAIAEAAPTRDRVLLVGLANEYLSYFTTEAEYDLQHYEGGSMLYGPGAAGKIEGLLRTLAADSDRTEPVRSVGKSYAYNVGPTASFGVKEFDLLKHTERLTDTYYSLANVLMDERTGIPAPNFPYMVWVDANPKWPSAEGEGQLVTPEVRIETRIGGEWAPLLVDGVPETDEGVDVVTTVVVSLMGKTRWNTTWMVPAGQDEGAELRIAAKGTSGKEFRSSPFTLTQARKAWGFVGIASPQEPGR